MDFVTPLCATGIGSSSCAVAQISALIEHSPDAPKQSAVSDSRWSMLGATHDGGGELKAGGVGDEDVNGEVRSEWEDVDRVANGDDDEDKEMSALDGKLYGTQATMTKAGNAEEDSIVAIPSGKEYASLAVLENVDANYYMSLSGAPCFDTESLSVEVFVYQYATDSWLLAELMLDWTRSWAWLHQWAYHEDDLVKRRGIQLRDVGREFSENVSRGLERLIAEKLCSIGESMFINSTKGEVGY